MMLNQYQSSLHQADSIEQLIKKYSIPYLVFGSSMLLFTGSLMSSTYGNSVMACYPEFSNLTDNVDYKIGSTMVGTAIIGPIILIVPLILCIKHERRYGVTAAKQAALLLGIIMSLIIAGFLEGLLGAATLGLHKPEQLQFAMRSGAIGNFNSYMYLTGGASLGVLFGIAIKGCLIPNANLAVSEEVNEAGLETRRQSLSFG